MNDNNETIDQLKVQIKGYHNSLINLSSLLLALCEELESSGEDNKILETISGQIESTLEELGSILK